MPNTIYGHNIFFFLLQKYVLYIRLPVFIDYNVLMVDHHSWHRYINI